MFFERLLEVFVLGLKSLFRNKLRSFLTMLGMIFGVGSVIAMLSVGAGARHEILSRIGELGIRNIIVNSISPGPVLTQPILDRLENDPDYINTRGTYLRSGRFGEPEEIAELAYYLAATDATYMQGADLIIDGGYTTH